MKKISVIFMLTISFMFLVSCEVQDVAVEAAISEITSIATSEDRTQQETVIETPHIPEVYKVKMTAVGDLMAHEWQVKGAYYHSTDTYDFTEAFKMVKPFIESADIAIGNLETTFGGKDKGYTYYPTFNTPDAFGEAIKNAGFDIVSTANNHSMDTSSYGLERTIDTLDHLGLYHMGTYKSQETRDEICIIESNNIKFAFLSYTYGTNGIPIPKDRPYLVNLIDLESMKADIKKARDEGVDFVIVMPHFGNEYELKQNKVQIALVDKLFEAGADIILGSHTHVVQPMEKRTIINSDGTKRTGFVIYSLGNFISSQTTEPRDASLILNFEFEKVEGETAKIKNISFIPTWVQFRKIEDRYCIRTLPVYKTLEDIEKKVGINIIEKEIIRMKGSAKDTLNRIYGDNLMYDDLKEEYVFEGIY